MDREEANGPQVVGPESRPPVSSPEAGRWTCGDRVVPGVTDAPPAYDVVHEGVRHGEVLMKLGIIGPQGPDLFATNIGDALTRMGHEVVALGSAVPKPGGKLTARASGVALRAIPELQVRLFRRLARSALRQECDVVLTTSHSMAPDAVAELRRNRVQVALWYPDHVANIGRQMMLVAPYTAVFTKEPLLAKRLRDTLGINVFYLPQACNPRWHRPVTGAAEERTIVVVGNAYPSRMLLLRRLAEAGIPLTLHGRGVFGYVRHLLPAGLRVRPPVFREEKSRVFRRAAAVLNNLHPAEMDGVNLRLFEATAAGAAVLCEDRRTLGELYDTEREVMPFRTFDELVDRARALLDDPRMTRDIGDAATKRAHAEHTYEERLRQLLEKVG